MFRRKQEAPVPSPSWLMVGLGNPGAEYLGTRHNVGFEVIDHLADQLRIKLNVRKHRAVYALGDLDGTDVCLAKPMTYMNLSGQAIAGILKSFGLNPSRLLVISDDLDLDVGRVRMKPKGGAGGHNGHRSIIQALGSSEYARIKIGIGKSGPAVDHVLSRFTREERPLIDEAIIIAQEGCFVAVREGVDAALSAVNSFKPEPS